MPSATWLPPQQTTTVGDPCIGEVATISINLQFSDGTTDTFWFPVLID